MKEIDYRSYLTLGAHPEGRDGEGRYRFRVWAPNAKSVSIIGDFNQWNRVSHPMRLQGETGIWETTIAGLKQFDSYKFSIETRSGKLLEKADPFAFHAETRPHTASKLYDINNFVWSDSAWMAERRKQGAPYNRPVSIYEMHLGSWRKASDGPDGIFYDYVRIGDELIPYLKKIGYTHVEFLPVMEHPLDASWGYQCTGYFAPTSRYGTPKEFMRLIDRLHGAGIGVILDWVPAHFPKDGHGLIEFDGSALYESGDPVMMEHPDWGTRIFDYAKPEVQAFLISSAYFWLDYYHADGIRIDAVASMLYLDYGREAGRWTPNIYGGRENLDAVAFIENLGKIIFRDFPDVIMAAEESSSWPMVTKPVYMGGLGFNYKWNMGWMNDILHYIQLDPLFRQNHHNDLTFSLMYAFSENFILPISHDEVVHGKKSLIGKMPGGYEDKFSGVRAFLTFMFAHPGKKLLFMGQEFGQFIEWNFDNGLDWLLLDYEKHRQLLEFVSALHCLYRESPPMWQIEDDWSGFEWICSDDKNGNTVVFLRRDTSGDELIFAINFSPVYRECYRIGVAQPGVYEEIFNTDAKEFGGGDRRNPSGLPTCEVMCHGKMQSIRVNIPPNGGVVMRKERSAHVDL